MLNGVPNSVPALDVKVNGNGKHRRYRARGRHFRGDVRAAAQRAVTGAQLYLCGTEVEVRWAEQYLGHLKLPTSLVEAATMVGSNSHYVEAAVIVLKTESADLLNDVLAGRQPLLEAARKAAKLSALVAAFHDATPADRAYFGRLVSPIAVWDGVVVPSLE